MKQKVLMLGAGFASLQRRLIPLSSAAESDTEWKSLDINPDAKPDYVFDLEWLEGTGPQIMDASLCEVPGGPYDEIHAYDVLEHFGQQGNYRGFFATFRRLHRALKPKGLLVGNCPAWDGVWAWADPGHTRIITKNTLGFLTKALYEDIGDHPVTDYRQYVDPYWWVLKGSETLKDTGKFFFVMEAV